MPTAPRVLNRRQYREYRIVGRLAAAATSERQRDQERDVLAVGKMPTDRDDAEHHDSDAGHPHLLVLGDLVDSSSRWHRFVSERRAAVMGDPRPPQIVANSTAG